MRSLRGFFGSVAFLLLLPVAIVYQQLFTGGLELVTHLVLAVGAVLFSLAVFDFKTPRWVTWIGCISIGALAVIFLLQALALAVQNDSLTYLAFEAIGQRLEKLLGMLFIFWCIVVLLMHSEGKTIILGLVVMAAVVISQICAYAMSYLGYAAAEEFKLLFLAMFVWLMLESAKKKHVF